jgi:hypothetical protein
MFNSHGLRRNARQCLQAAPSTTGPVLQPLVLLLLMLVPQVSAVPVLRLLVLALRVLALLVSALHGSPPSLMLSAMVWCV